MERITMINATSSLDYQYVSGTAGRVAVAGIAVYVLREVGPDASGVVARYDITTNI